MNEEEIVCEIAEVFMRFCMPRESYGAAIVFAQEIYDTEVKPMLRDAWAEGKRAHESDPNPYA